MILTCLLAWSTSGTADAQRVVDSWQYTLRRPAEGWKTADFDAEGWREGNGGFGTRDTPNARVGTVWATNSIWLRKSFKLEDVPAKPALLIHHDENTEVYLNGQAVATLKGYSRNYKVVPIPATKHSSLRAGENLMAVHCSQTTGGQFIDVHLVDAENVPELPAAKRNTTPFRSTLITRWGEQVTPENAWTQYPRPQMQRRDWTNLNGHWDYAITPAKQLAELHKVLFQPVAKDASQFPDSAFIQTRTDRKPAPVMDPESIRAGLKSHDRALYIKSGWIRDPYITIGPDGYFYLTGTQPNPDDPRESEDPYNIGLAETSIVGEKVRVWRSEDLIEWESLGAPFTLDDTFHVANLKKNPGKRLIWAPEIHWMGNRWALVHCPRQVSSFALSAGQELSGPWTHPMGENLGSLHDPSLFTDDDGTVYMLWQNTLVAPLSEDLTRYTADPVRIDPAGTRPGPDGEPISRIGHEGATMIKVGGKYVHLGTAWSTDQGRKGSYNLYYCVADKITGPYGPRKFAGRFLGHGTPFQDKEGKWWCTAFFNANVPPVPREGIESRDLGENAQTINEQGVTIVPLEVRLLDNGEVYLRAKDPAYATPGPDEAQKFED